MTSRRPRRAISNQVKSMKRGQEEHGQTKHYGVAFSGNQYSEVRSVVASEIIVAHMRNTTKEVLKWARATRGLNLTVMSSRPCGEACFRGHVHEHQPAGEEITLGGGKLVVPA